MVVGDAFCATTHSDLYLRAIGLNIEVRVIHNASIISAVGCCGLQVYRFGEVVSVKERTEENILKDKKVYEPPRFMTIA